MNGWFRLEQVGLVGTLLVLAAGQAAAQDEAFKRAMDARDDRRWSEVVDWLRQAIAEDPQESTRGVRTGFVGRTRYLPHFFLGQAYFEQGNCAAAVTSWGTSQNQKVVNQEREYSGIMQQGLAACAARGVLLPSEYDTPFSSADQSIKAAMAVASRVSQYGKQNLGVWQSRPEWSADYSRATRAIEQAGRQFESAKGTRLRREFDAARELADSAATALLDLEKAVTGAVAAAGALSAQITALRETIEEALVSDRQIDALDTDVPPALVRTRQNAQRQIQVAQERLATGTREQSAAVIAEGQKAAHEAVASLASTLTDTHAFVKARQAGLLQSEVSSGSATLLAVEASLARLEAIIAERQTPAAAAQDHQVLRQDAAAARRRFEQASTKEDLRALQRANRAIAGIQQKVAAALARFGTATLRDRGVPESLENATRLFIDGEFAQAAATLGDESWRTNQRLAIHGYLLRGAALYQLFLRGGERDQALRTRAAAAVQAAQAHDAAFAPDVRLFGPRFLEFYRTAGGHATDPASSSPSR